jgi:hypothetical protein
MHRTDDAYALDPDSKNARELKLMINDRWDRLSER